MTLCQIFACDVGLAQNLSSFIAQGVEITHALSVYIHVPKDEKGGHKAIPCVVLFYEPITEGSTHPLDKALPFEQNTIETEAMKKYKEMVKHGYIKHPVGTTKPTGENSNHNDQ